VVSDILSGTDIGTIFLPKVNRLQVRKRWLAFGARIRGAVTVDAGCEQAILKGASLLAAGITAVDGGFEHGNTIRIVTAEGREIARGIANYNAADTRRIMGAHTNEIAAILGSKPYDEVIHRDNMVLLV
jgi:glutamate 5-kinase